MQEDFQKTDIKRVERAELAWLSDRHLWEYENIFGLDFNTMEGKLVLDIGSGESEIFSKEAAKKKVKVVSISPHLKEISTDKELKKILKKGWEKRSVATLGQRMPFNGNVFDVEIGLFSIPYYLSFSEKEYKEFFSEVARTLKVGGVAYFFPIFNLTLHNHEQNVDIIKKSLAHLKESITYNIEEFSLDNYWGVSKRLVLHKISGKKS